MRRIIGQFVLLLVFYLLLVGKLTWPEGMAGCVIAAIAVMARESACRCGGARHVFASGWAKQFIRLPGRVVTDTGRVFAAAGRAAVHPKGVGRFLHVPFDPGGDDPASAGRRALVVGGLSVTPNAIAVQIEPDKQRLLVHQLADAPPPGKEDRQWPI
jgi:multisubunit Na+/H+ antiporter MnhE subunit